MRDVLIILGGGIDIKTQQINSWTKLRYDKAIDIEKDFKWIIPSSYKTYRKDIADKIFTTESKAGRDYLIKNGVTENKIILEEFSRDTFSNAYYCRKIIDEKNLGKKITVVTNKFHMPKTKLVFNLTFDKEYSLEFLEVENLEFEGAFLNKRIISENEVIDFYNKYLKSYYGIVQGDMMTIKNYMENINPAMTGIYDENHLKLDRLIKEKIGLKPMLY